MLGATAATLPTAEVTNEKNLKRPWGIDAPLDPVQAPEPASMVRESKLLPQQP